MAERYDSRETFLSHSSGLLSLKSKPEFDYKLLRGKISKRSRSLNLSVSSDKSEEEGYKRAEL